MDVTWGRAMVIIEEALEGCCNAEVKEALTLIREAKKKCSYSVCCNQISFLSSEHNSEAYLGLAVAEDAVRSAYIELSDDESIHLDSYQIEVFVKGLNAVTAGKFDEFLERYK